MQLHAHTHTHTHTHTHILVNRGHQKIGKVNEDIALKDEHKILNFEFLAKSFLTWKVC